MNMLTEKELGLPWCKTHKTFIADSKGETIAIINRLHPDKRDFIVHAANQHYALVGLLAEINASLCSCLSQDDSIALQERIDALLAQQTPQEADND